MGSFSYSLLRAVCALVMGLILILFPDKAGEYLVITLGVVFAFPSLISVIKSFMAVRCESFRFPLMAIGCFFFGLWLIVSPGFFADLLTYVLGFILLLGGIHQIALLMASRRWMPVSSGFYVLPSLILLAGLLALFNPVGVRSTAFVFIGISCMAYALSELLSWFKFTRRRSDKRKGHMASDAEDVEIHI